MDHLAQTMNYVAQEKGHSHNQLPLCPSPDPKFLTVAGTDSAAAKYKPHIFTKKMGS